MQSLYFLIPPPGRSFDVATLESRLKQLPGAVRHPAPDEVCYVIAPNREMAQRLARSLVQNPMTSLASQGVVTLSPTGIRVEQDSPPPVIAQIRTFVCWLMGTLPCRVISEEGEDWTRRYATHP